MLNDKTKGIMSYATDRKKRLDLFSYTKQSIYITNNYFSKVHKAAIFYHIFDNSSYFCHFRHIIFK